MPYNSETETFYQAPATVVDSTPDGDTVQEGFDDRLTPAMAGLYADLNLLKADGMISVGIPATTTARGIGRVATSDDLVDGATINNGPAFLAAAEHTSVVAAAGKVPVADSNGKLDAWVSPQTQYAACATASATAAKEATLTGFALVKGARVFITFTNPNVVAGALTLNVNETGAKPIYNDLGAVSATNFASFRAGIPLEFIYDGTNWTYKTWEASGNAFGQYFYARDEKPTGTDGGTSAGSAWQTRDLNTVVKPADWASLAANRFTLKAGKYYVRGNTPAMATYTARAAIYDVTHASYILYGHTIYGNTYDGTYPEDVEGEINLTETTTLELRQYTGQVVGSYGLGKGGNTGLKEIYSGIRIWKL